MVVTRRPSHERVRAVLVGLTLGAASLGCAQDDGRAGPGATTAPDTKPSTTSVDDELAEEGGLDGPVMFAARSDGVQMQMAAEIIGTLELDGECLYTAFDGVRYPVLWPYGTTWDEEASSVVLPDGTTFAVGDEISGGGGYLRSIAEYTRDENVLERAELCGEEPYFEIAILQYT